VKGIDNVEVQRALDLGAHGIVFPQLKSLEDFRSAVECMKYPPLGRRGFNPFTRAGNYGGKPSKENKLTNEYALCVPIVETLSAVEQLDKILALPGIDLIYVGTYDLSVQLGCKGDMVNPKLRKTVGEILGQCRMAKKPACLMVNSAKDVEHCKKLGAFAYVYTVDTIVVRDAFQQKSQVVKLNEG
jgi:4-hydroxy-2-oxoheptanedioate aldolase